MYIEKLKQYCNENSKYFIWHSNLIKQNFGKNDLITSIRGQKSKLDGYYEAHYILPKAICSKDEANDLENYVFLTPRQHYIAHMLLRKMVINKLLKIQMNNAFYMMSNTSKFYNSIIYEKAREGHSKRLSEQFKGRKSSLKGKSYEEIHGVEKSNLMKEEKSKIFKDRVFSEETKQLMKDNHSDVSGAKNPMSKSGRLFNNLNEEIFSFDALLELREYCEIIGLPFRGLKSNGWNYNPNITTRNKKFQDFIGYNVIFG